MTDRVLARAAETSAAVAAARRILHGSLFYAGLVRFRRWSRTMTERAAIGLRARRHPASPAAVRQLDARIASESRTVQGLMALAHLPARAWESAQLRHAIDGVLALDLAVRIRLAGIVLLVAVVTHTVLMAAMGISVFTLGWAARAVCAALGLALFFSPAPFAAAWRQRRS